MLLVTVLVGVLWFQSQEVLTDFQCPEMAACSCSRDWGSFEILCPKTSNQPALIVKFSPNGYMELNCRGMKELDLRLLSGLKIGPVVSINIMLCPLPEISFKELMLTLGIPSSENLYVESYSGILTSRHLEGLHELGALSLISNDLTKLPEDLFKDVENLLSLNLGNNNAQLTKATFRYVPDLRILQLDRNNINYLEPGIFRNVTDLWLLNLSGNRLQNLSRSVFSDTPYLESIDLNSNGLTTLPPDVFADLKGLTGVNLYDNEFRTLPQSLFQNTRQLETIRINNNRGTLKTLPPAFFANLTKLIELDLKNSNLSSLPEDLLWGCVSLKYLKLQKNLLTELPEKIFKDTKNFATINLSHNRLVSLPESLFSSQQKLETLDLSHNKLTTISQGLFSSLKMLDSLELEDNRIKFIDPNAFEASRALRAIICPISSHDKLSVIQGDLDPDKLKSKSILQNCQNLKNIDLSYNQLSSIYSVLRYLTSSHPILNLSPNSTNITIGDLQFIANKVTLDFRNNKITLSLMSDAEHDVAQRKFAGRRKIILDENPFACDFNAYHLVKYLRGQLDPEVKGIEVIDPSMLTCESPEELKGTRVVDLDPRQLTCPIEKLVKKNDCPKNCLCLYRPSNSALLVNCSYRGLTSIPSSLPTPIFLEEWMKVNHTELDLTGNKITFLPNKLGKGYSDVTKIYLSYNNLTSINLTIFGDHLQIGDLQFKANEVTLDIRNNMITKLLMNEAEEIAQRKSAGRTIIILEENPFVCDCYAYHLVKYFRNELDPEVKRFVVIKGNKLTCDSPEELKGTEVMDLDPRQLTCLIEKLVKKNDCPKNCLCLYRPSNSALLVNCSYRGLTNIPSSLPTPIFLEEWMKVNHTELDLTGNKITFLPNKLGKGYSDVTKIYLSYNNLTSINLTSFSDHLQIIELDHNNLTRIDEAFLMTVKESKHIKNVSLLNNPWICDCKAMFFLKLMRVNDEKISHQENLTCSNGVPFSEVIVSDLCLTDAIETQTMTAAIETKTTTAIVIISVTLAFLCLLIGGSTAAYYRYQREIKVWLYANKLCLWFVTEEELDKDKLYDAFISYSHQDERFVVEDLVPGLENGPTKFKLCLHYRDWVVGEFIPNQIARSVEESRRTVVILSPNFLESIWGRMEFRAAHSQALSEGRVRVIIILYGDIGPVDNLDPELKAYLSMNTYIKWGDPWFWEKLRYALPHSPELSKGIPLISHPNIRRNSGEKLMNGTDPKTMPPAITRPPADALFIEPLKTLLNSKPV